MADYSKALRELENKLQRQQAAITATETMIALVKEMKNATPQREQKTK